MYLGAEIAAWARQASCNFELGDLDVTWNTVIPSKTMTQMDVGIFTVLWLQVGKLDVGPGVCVFFLAPLVGTLTDMEHDETTQTHILGLV